MTGQLWTAKLSLAAFRGHWRCGHQHTGASDLLHLGRNRCARVLKGFEFEESGCCLVEGLSSPLGKQMMQAMLRVHHVHWLYNQKADPLGQRFSRVVFGFIGIWSICSTATSTHKFVIARTRA